MHNKLTSPGLMLLDFCICKHQVSGYGQILRLQMSVMSLYQLKVTYCPVKWGFFYF